MRTDHHHATTSSHIRPLVLDADSAGPANTADDNARFADTGRLTEQSTDAMVKALLKLKVGDRASCSLFVRAMEYQLRDFLRALASERQATAPPAAPQATDHGPANADLVAIARAARELAALLDALPNALKPGLLQSLEARDAMHRGYDARYLDQLRIEALRLDDACGSEATQTGFVTEAEAAHAERRLVSPATLDFIALLGSMFEECFEKPPTAAPDGPFARALGVIGEGIGVQLPTDPATLEVALGRA